MKNPLLSIVIPAYNEETNIRLGTLDKVARYLESVDYIWETIIVNDGSTDGTTTLLADFVNQNRGFRLIQNPHQGKAYSVISGIMEAAGNIVLFTDLDQATPLREAEKLMGYINRGYDVAIGSRSNRRQGAPITRLVMSRGFMILRTLILGLGGIDDTQCGFKAFKREVIRRIISQLKLYGKKHKASGSRVSAGFDIELLYLVKKLGYKIKEVPVEWHFVETRRVNPLFDSWQGLSDILRIRINAWRGLYN